MCEQVYLAPWHILRVVLLSHGNSHFVLKMYSWCWFFLHIIHLQRRRTHESRRREWWRRGGWWSRFYGNRFFIKLTICAAAAVQYRCAAIFQWRWAAIAWWSCAAVFWWRCDAVMYRFSSICLSWVQHLGCLRTENQIKLCLGSLQSLPDLVKAK